MFRKRRWQLAACCLLTALVTIAAVVGTEAVLLNRLTGSASESVRFLRTMNLLKRNYNGEVDNHQLFDGAIKGMVEAAGDPYTVYLNSKDFQQLSEMTGGSFGGIGIVFGKRGNDYVVISALEDNPGAKAGIKSGDIITAIDGNPTRDMNMEQVANKIRGKHGTVVKLEHDEVLVDIGFKSEGVIPARELSIRKDANPADIVALGDPIEALVLLSLIHI